MFEEYKYLPASARRYSVSCIGEVINHSGSELVKDLIDGEHYVELEWVDGKKLYNVAIVVMVAFGLLDFEDHLWPQIKPIYKDSDKTNLSPSNLTYGFKTTPLECEEHPGYYRIPFFSRYCINDKGVLKNILTNHQLSWHITPPNVVKGSQGGYRSCRVVGVFGATKGLLRHRALCLAFKEYDTNPSTLVVNHIDGIPGHDSLNNLEWTSYQNNNLHAYALELRPNATTPILVMHISTGVVEKFSSISECHRKIKTLSPGNIQYRLRYSKNKVFSDGLLFKLDDGSEWPDISSHKLMRNKEACDIVARNVFTGEKIIFRGGQMGEDLLGIKKETILAHAAKDLDLPINGFNFRYLLGGAKFPAHTNKHLEVYLKYPVNQPEAVDVYDHKDGIELFFTSRREAAKHYGVSIATLAYFIRTGKRFEGRYTFKYFKLKENLSPLME